MEFYSLLESYGHVVYENKKVSKKRCPKNIFSSDEKIPVEFLTLFSENPTFSENTDFFENPTFHRPISEPYTSFFHLKHSAIDRSPPQLYPGMFFVANGCLTVENELSEVGTFWAKTNVIFP